MHFPKYWHREFVKENGLEASGYGWSDRSIEEAKENAIEKVRVIFRRLRSKETLERYGYPRGVMREEVIERFDSEQGEEAVISRNRYGALVLNASKTMFVDIDDEQEKSQKPQVGFFEPILSILRLFKGGPGPEEGRVPQEAMEKRKGEIDGLLKGWELKAAMYRTKAGVRLLILNRMFDPADDDTRRLLEMLKSDPLYIQLTGNQKCFRARLTPKPWRIGHVNPPACYPMRNPQEKRLFEEWLDQYIQLSKGYGICGFLGNVGVESEDHPQAAFIRELHDQYCIRGGFPLA